MKFLTDECIRRYWSNGIDYIFEGKKYLIHKMNYGDYFIEPKSWKGRERDGFSPQAKWFTKMVSKDMGTYYELQ